MCAAMTGIESGVTGILTSGINYEKYRFGGRKERKYELINIRREGKRTSGIMEYTRGWNGGKIIECEWKDILRNNDQINTINNMITDLRNKTIKNATDGGGKTVKGNIAFATKKVKSEKEEAGKVTRKEGIN